MNETFPAALHLVSSLWFNEAGNQILYLLCEKASQFIGFRFAAS